MDNEIEDLINSFLAQVAERKMEDTNRIIRGEISSMEKYNFAVGRIKAFLECESIISDLLKQSEY